MVINFDDAKKASQLQNDYDKFLQTVIKNDAIWFLCRRGNLAIIETKEEGDNAPAWSTEEAAKACKKGEWKGFDAMKVSVAEFIDMCIPDLFEEKINIVAEFCDGSGLFKNLQALEDDLFEEADRQGIPLEEMCMDLQDFVEAENQFDDFLEELLDEGILWILTYDDGETVFVDVDDDEALPVWTSEGEAMSACTSDWEGCRPQAVSFEKFVEDWEPALTRDGVSIMFDLDEVGGMGTDAKTLAGALRKFACAARKHTDNIINFPLQ